MTSSEEVLLASTHSSETISARRTYSSCLSSSRSGAASITSSHSAIASNASTGSIRAVAASASSALSLPLTASLASPSRARAAPRWSASASGSCSSVRAPERAASWAMPEPIVPAPTTPITRAERAVAVGCSGTLCSGGDERVDARHTPPNDQLLDLRGTLVEGRDARVTEVALDRMIVDVARAAVYLDREIRALQ